MLRSKERFSKIPKSSFICFYINESVFSQLWISLSSRKSEHSFSIKFSLQFLPHRKSGKVVLRVAGCGSSIRWVRRIINSFLHQLRTVLPLTWLEKGNLYFSNFDWGPSAFQNGWICSYWASCHFGGRYGGLFIIFNVIVRLGWKVDSGAKQ